MSSTDMLEANDCSLSIMKEHTTDWQYCAGQGEDCRCAGVIRYGDPASDRWSGPHMTDGGVRNCNDGEFGDPAWGVRKLCQCNKYYPSVEIGSDKIKFSSIKDKNEDRYGQVGINSDGSWAPDTADMDEWLQVDLGSNKTIGAVATQGDPRRVGADYCIHHQGEL